MNAPARGDSARRAEEAPAATTAEHLPVLVDEVVQGLAPRPGETYVDCTAGLGGHARAIASAIGRSGRVVLIDTDPANVERAAAHVRTLDDAPTVVARQGNFALVEALLAGERVRADMVLADLGMASNQLDDPSRGFSFAADGPLDMRLDPTLPATAADVVNTLAPRELAEVIFRFGEEPFARRIAARIAVARESAPITTTGRLAEIVREAYGARAHTSRVHPATRTFMALRIRVNDELGALDRLLDAIERGARAAAAGSPAWLSEKCRVAIISFHSLEDRKVKRSFRGLAREGLANEAWKRPVEAGEEERRRNPRARSAKLRLLRLDGRC